MDKFNGYTYEEAKKLNIFKDRWVYDLRSGRWHLVGSNDRDYTNGLSKDFINKRTEAQAIQFYLIPFFNGALGRAVDQRLVKDVRIIREYLSPEEVKEAINYDKI